MNPPLLLRGLVIGLTVLVIGLAAVCGYQYVARAMTTRDITTVRGQLADARQYAAETANWQAQSQAQADGVLTHPAPWTWSEQLPVMVAQISEITQRHDVKIDTLQPVSVVEKPGILRFPLRLSLKMDLTTLTGFLQGIKKAMPVLAVDALAVRTGRHPGDPLTVELTLSSYVTLEGRRTGGKP